MANRVQLAVLRDGGAAWNAWRTQHPNVMPDFTRAELSGINLAGANLLMADFTRAKLSDIDLSNANLDYATFTKATLANVSLDHAKMQGTILVNTTLANTTLTDAKLIGAKLMGSTLAADLTRATLSDANLTGTTFINATLKDVTLSYSIMSDVTLNRAILTNANLSHANLSRASLVYADLSRARLNNAILSDADLTHATLIEVDLSDASLRGADFQDAICGRTIFVNLNLALAENLASMHHHAPSTINTDTIFKSRSDIPDAFLRGCGMPETRGEIPLEVQPPDCTIVYHEMDEKFARRLGTVLKSQGVRGELAEGSTWEGSIPNAAHKLLLCCSVHTLTSEWLTRLPPDTSQIIPLNLDGVLESDALRGEQVDRLRSNANISFVGWDSEIGKIVAKGALQQLLPLL